MLLYPRGHLETLVIDFYKLRSLILDSMTAVKGFTQNHPTEHKLPLGKKANTQLNSTLFT